VPGARRLVSSVLGLLSPPIPVRADSLQVPLQNLRGNATEHQACARASANWLLFAAQQQEEPDVQLELARLGDPRVFRPLLSFALGDSSHIIV